MVKSRPSAVRGDSSGIQPYIFEFIFIYITYLSVNFVKFGEKIIFGGKKCQKVYLITFVSFIAVVSVISLIIVCRLCTVASFTFISLSCVS